MTNETYGPKIVFQATSKETWQLACLRRRRYVFWDWDYWIERLLGYTKVKATYDPGKFPSPGPKVLEYADSWCDSVVSKEIWISQWRRRKINPFYSLDESYRHDLSGVWVSTTIFHFRFCVYECMFDVLWSVHFWRSLYQFGKLRSSGDKVTNITLNVTGCK